MAIISLIIMDVYFWLRQDPQEFQCLFVCRTCQSAARELSITIFLAQIFKLLPQLSTFEDGVRQTGAIKYLVLFYHPTVFLEHSIKSIRSLKYMVLMYQLCCVRVLAVVTRGTNQLPELTSSKNRRDAEKFKCF